jgi:CII-binding regulator of phage lambda lysogenization HflD
MVKLDGWGPPIRGRVVLGAQLTRLQAELARKTQYAAKLELALHQRSQRIDELANTIATLREQNRRLDEEAENYFRMLAAG